MTSRSVVSTSALLLVVSLCGIAACSPKVDPDQGSYTCNSAVDCGGQFECRTQFSGGGRCFPAGACTDTELCDGKDNNCDGRIDETFPEANVSCSTGLQGECAAGSKQCVSSAVACVQKKQPSPELCNQLDDDCDGQSDELFDLATDSANCGRCGVACDAGTSCRSAMCVESACGDGIDNDGDGGADCDDLSCLDQTCDTQSPPSRCGTLDAGPSDAGAIDAGDSSDGGLPADGGAPDGGATDGGLPTDGGAPIRACLRP